MTLKNTTLQTAQSALRQTAQDLQDRSEIEAVVADLVTDVEIAADLHRSLRHRHETRTLQRRLQEYERAVAEVRAVRHRDAAEQTALADALVQELLQLSEELGDLKQVKQEHERLLMQYDEVVAKLLQAEDNLAEETERRERQEQVQAQQQSNTRTNDVEEEKPPAEEEKDPANALPSPENDNQDSKPPASNVEATQGAAAAADLDVTTLLPNTAAAAVKPPPDASSSPPAAILEEESPAPTISKDETPISPAPAPVPEISDEEDSDDSNEQVVALVLDEDDDDNDETPPPPPLEIL